MKGMLIVQVLRQSALSTKRPQPKVYPKSRRRLASRLMGLRGSCSIAYVILGKW